MDRIRAGATPGTQAISRVKMQPEITASSRVKADTPDEVKRVKIEPKRVYNGGFTKDAKTGWLYKDGEYYRKVD